MGQPSPFVKIEILEEFKNEKDEVQYNLIRDYVQYLTKDEKNITFSDIKRQFQKSDGWHHCVLKICSYDNDKLKEYKEANVKNSKLKIKDSIFKATKESKASKIKKHSRIPIILINEGECICEQIAEQRYKEYVNQFNEQEKKEHKEEIEKLRKAKDKLIEELKRNRTIEQNEIIHLKNEMKVLNGLKDDISKQFEQNLNELKQLKEVSKENPKNKESLRLFNSNKYSIETKVINEAKSKVDIYFDFHFFKESYSSQIKNKFHDIVKEIFQKEKYSNKLKKDILKMLKDNPLWKKNKHPIEHFNILVLGPSGVGKSTLINSMLLLDEKIDGAKTGIGVACTKGKPKEYESKKIEGIRLYDTQGIELGDYNIKAVQKDATELIKSKLDSGDPDKYMHCIWYCVAETRFHTEEQDCLKELMNMYQKNIMPILIIYGKAVDEELTSKMLKEIGKFIELNKSHELVVIPILAKEMAKIKPFGKNKLLEETVNKLKNAIESSCYEGMRKTKLKEFHKDFESKLIKINEKQGKINQKENNKEKLVKFFKEKFENLLGISKIKEDNFARLSIFLCKIYNDFNEEFEKKMKDFSTIFGDKLFNDYFEEYKRLDNENGSEIVSTFQIGTLNSAKNKIQRELEEEIKKERFPLIFQELENSLIRALEIRIEEVFNDIILSNIDILKELKTQIDKIVNISYDEIYKKIQNCRKNHSDFYEENPKSEKEEKKKEEEKKPAPVVNLFDDIGD